MPADRVTSQTPWHIVLVLDDSGSMSGLPAASLNAAVEKMFSIMQLKSQGKKPYFRVSLISFGSSPKVLAEAVDEQAIDIPSVTTFDGSSGGTDTAAALRRAADVLRNHGGNETDFVPYVFFMSDGGADNPSDALKAAEALKQLAIPAGNPRILAIGTQNADENFMKAVASSPELYVFCDPDKLGKLFPEIGTLVGGPDGGGADGMDQAIVDVIDATEI